MRVVALLCLLFAAFPAFAGGFGPWKFGMSADEIRAAESHGPYRAFSNGDLETYSAEFGGRSQNAQFYLKDGTLWRIALRTFEGTDLSKATRAWMETYTILKELHGSLETPGLSGEDLAALAECATAIVANGGKAQMAPVAQPEGVFVFSSFNSHTHEGVTYYMVTVNYDQPAP
jgi:hypothetical protein